MSPSSGGASLPTKLPNAPKPPSCPGPGAGTSAPPGCGGVATANSGCAGVAPAPGAAPGLGAATPGVGVAPGRGCASGTLGVPVAGAVGVAGSAGLGGVVPWAGVPGGADDVEGRDGRVGWGVVWACVRCTHRSRIRPRKRGDRSGTASCALAGSSPRVWQQKSKTPRLTAKKSVPGLNCTPLRDPSTNPAWDDPPKDAFRCAGPRTRGRTSGIIGTIVKTAQGKTRLMTESGG